MENFNSSYYKKKKGAYISNQYWEKMENKTGKQNEKAIKEKKI